MKNVNEIRVATTKSEKSFEKCEKIIRFFWLD